MPSRIIGRQPILNRSQRTVGYDLLFQPVAGEEVDEQTATVRMILDVLHVFGPDALLGSALGFIRVDPELLQSEAIEALPKDRIVLELPYLENPSAALKARCRELSRRRTKIALAGYRRRDPREELLPCASHVRMNAAELSQGDLRQVLRTARKNNASAIAGGVESPKQYAELESLGLQLFQGFYFAKPTIVEGQSVDANHTALVELIAKLEGNVSLEEIEEGLKRSPSLGLNLLRLVNSLALARAHKIGSISQALMMIGRKGLSRWLNVLLFAGGQTDSPASPLFELAATRGKMMEALQLDRIAAGASEKNSEERAFLTGMLSLVDTLMGRPLDEILGGLAVAPDVVEALIEGSGELGVLLSLAIALERHDRGDFAPMLDELGLTAEQVKQAQVEAFVWVNQL